MSHTPLISICLPNLNNRSYLPHRFASIVSQTLDDWELIVSDNYSDDGAWEYIQEMARMDPRTRASQAPREGMYANWNRCIALARGK
jgi:glycosyltransferase involved in cell wall biosynthesis